MCSSDLSYLEVVHGQLTGRPPVVDLALEAAVQAFLRQAIAAGLVSAAHDLSDGGLAVAAAECCLAGGLGARFALPTGLARPDRVLFAEGGARLLVSVPAAQAEAWQSALHQAGAAVPAQRLGTVEAEPSLTIQQGTTTWLQLPVAALRDAFEQAIPRRLREAGPPPEH